MTIRLYDRLADWEIPFDTTTFSGGEPHVHIQRDLTGLNLLIDARPTSGDDFLLLLLLKDAVDQFRPDAVHLYIPYFPGARQDRREPGFGFTAAIYADLVNRAAFDTVTILDPHSPVSPEMLSMCSVQSPTAAIRKFLQDSRINGLICPDAGAIERVTHEAARADLPVIYCRKIRDPQTGRLSGFEADPIPFSGNWAVVDDICDGGGTFLGLADLIKSRNAPNDHQARLFLWVTHGIFSKGFGALLESFAGIGTTDSFPGNLPGDSDRVSIIKINQRGITE